MADARCIEANDEGWLVMVGGEGSMLIGRHAIEIFPNDVFEDMWPWEVETWASRRGIWASAKESKKGWTLEVGDGGGFFELLLIKAWWRSLGRGPVETAIERLTCEISSPVWLPT